MKFTIQLHCILAIVCIYIPNKTKMKIIKYQLNNIKLKVCSSSFEQTYKTKHMMNE